jgi:amidase
VGAASLEKPVGIQVVADFLRDRTALTAAARIGEVLGGFRPPPGYGA